MLRALRHPAFRVIWASYIVSQAGFWVSNVSLQWLVVRLSGGDALSQGLLFFFNFIPILILSPVGGLLADRYNRKRVAVACQASLGIVAGLLAASEAARLVTLPVLYGFAFCLGVALAMGGPVGQAIIANSVPRSDLSSAVSLQSAGVNLCRVAGPALAVPILLSWGAAPAFGLYSIAALSTSALLSRIALPVVQKRSGDIGWWKQLRHGFEHAAERRPALTVLSLVAVSAVFASSYVALIPVFAYTVLGQNATGFGALVIATGVGAAVGALATGLAEGGTRVVVSAVQMLCLCVSLAVFALTRDFRLALVVAAIVGGLNFALMTTLNSTLQYLVDDERRGRVMSLYLLSWGGLVPVGGLMIGGLARLLDPPRAVLIFAAVGALYAMFVGLRHRAESIPLPNLNSQTMESGFSGEHQEIAEP